MTKLNKIGALLDKFCSKVGTKFLVKWRRDIFFIALIWCAIIAVFCRPKRMELFYFFFSQLSERDSRLSVQWRGAFLKPIGILGSRCFFKFEWIQGAPYWSLIMPRETYTSRNNNKGGEALPTAVMFVQVRVGFQGVPKWAPWCRETCASREGVGLPLNPPRYITATMCLSSGGFRAPPNDTPWCREALAARFPPKVFPEGVIWNVLRRGFLAKSFSWGVLKLTSSNEVYSESFQVN